MWCIKQRHSWEMWNKTDISKSREVVKKHNCTSSLRLWSNIAGMAGVCCPSICVKLSVDFWDFLAALIDLVLWLQAAEVLVYLTHGCFLKDLTVCREGQYLLQAYGMPTHLQALIWWFRDKDQLDFPHLQENQSNQSYIYDACFCRKDLRQFQRA